MLAIVQGPDGTDLTLHRTYLTNQGTKAPREGRKLMPVADGKKTTGGAIRLFESEDTLAIAEGIETALAVHVITGLPVWPRFRPTGWRGSIHPRASSDYRSTATTTSAREASLPRTRSPGGS